MNFFFTCPLPQLRNFSNRQQKNLNIFRQELPFIIFWVFSFLSLSACTLYIRVCLKFFIYSTKNLVHVCDVPEHLNCECKHTMRRRNSSVTSGKQSLHKSTQRHGRIIMSNFFLFEMPDYETRKMHAWGKVSENSGGRNE